ncbi:MAG TPA: hypothetical protein VLJ38_20085 [Polyangiaceae bacterium]|nr:hypothetical protein [Polyangiaceae bacterium]
MNGDSELDPFTAALREDLPTAADEARLRVRLASAGLLAGTGLLTPAGSAAATATATTGVFAKLVALPLAVKVGASLALAGVAVVPLVRFRSQAAPAPAEVSARAVASVTAPPARRTAEGARRVDVTDGAEARVPVPPGVAAASSVSAEAVASGEPASSAKPEHGPVPGTAVGAGEMRASSRGGREVAMARNVGSGAPAATSSLPAVAAFPEPPSASEDEGTLRAETAVMEHALAALKRGDFGTARRELALHAAQFPNGHLAPERDRALARIREKTTP